MAEQEKKITSEEKHKNGTKKLDLNGRLRNFRENGLKALLNGP